MEIQSVLEVHSWEQARVLLLARDEVHAEELRMLLRMFPAHERDLGDLISAGRLRIVGPRAP